MSLFRRRSLLRTLRLTALPVVAVAFLAAAVPSAMADVRIWTGEDDSSWANDLNWDDNLGAVADTPDASDSVVIPGCDPSDDEVPINITDVPAGTLVLTSFTVDSNFGTCANPTLTGVDATSALTAPVMTLRNGRFNSIDLNMTAGGTSTLGGDGDPVILGIAGPSSLTTADNAVVSLQGPVTLETGAVLTNAGDITVTGFDGAITGSMGTINNQGTGSINIEGIAVISTPVTNTGSITVSGAADDNYPALTLTSVLTTNGSGSFTNEGDLNLEGGSLAGSSNDIVNEDTGTIRLTADSTLDGSLKSTGSIDLYSDTDQDNDYDPIGYTLAGSGAIVVNPTSDDFTNGVDIDYGAAINGPDVALNGDTALRGNGDIAGDITVGNGASITPWRSNPDPDDNRILSGELNVTGDVDFEAGSTLDLLSRGPGEPETIDGTSRLTVTGTTTISGTETTLLLTTYAAESGNETYIAIDGSIAPVGAFQTFTKRNYSDVFGNGVYGVASTVGTDIIVTNRIATLAVAAGTVRPGQAFSVSGNGYVPGEQVFVSLDKADPMSDADFGIASATVTASGTGSIAASLTVPASAAAGAYNVSAYGVQSQVSLQASATVTAPVASPVLDTDGDKLNDSVDCAPNDKNKPAQGAGVVDKDCNGVNDAIQPIKFIGSKKNDNITGAGGNDVLSGGLGNDKIAGGFGNDKLSGGAGNDNLDGGAGNDSVDGGVGNDKVSGGAGNDKLAGGAGNDTLNGGVGKDTMSGGSGNDKIVANDRLADKITCGPGKDSVVADKGDKVAKDCEKVTRRK